MRVAIFGATGYGGTETMRLLTKRPDVELAFVGSDSQAGLQVEQVLPQFRGSYIGKLTFSPYTQGEDLSGVDAVLLAMPHGQAQKMAPRLLEQGMRVIDFSGDFRLTDDLYETWYKRRSQVTAHEAVYGLPELYREEIKGAMLIANPGCYATSSELALLPALEHGLIEPMGIMIDAKSGVSGAGRSPQLTTHFVEVEESMRAYKVGAHQHTPEIERILADAMARRNYKAGGGQETGGVGRKAGSEAVHEVRVLLTTQLLPIKRGIYVTAYGRLREDLSAQNIWELYRNRYEGEPFVSVLPLGQTPEIRYVTGTNHCHIGIHVDVRTNTLLVMSAIDNLGKGAAGQALQNMNLMFGLQETLGLDEPAWW